MSNVEFDADNQGRSFPRSFGNQYPSSQYNPQSSERASGVTGLFMKIGLKNESQAKALMVLVFLLNFLITGFVLYKYVLN